MISRLSWARLREMRFCSSGLGTQATLQQGAARGSRLSGGPQFVCRLFRNSVLAAFISRRRATSVERRGRVASKPVRKCSTARASVP